MEVSSAGEKVCGCQIDLIHKVFLLSYHSFFGGEFSSFSSSSDFIYLMSTLIIENWYLCMISH